MEFWEMNSNSTVKQLFFFYVGVKTIPVRYKPLKWVRSEIRLFSDWGECSVCGSPGSV